MHTVSAGYVTGSMFVLGISSWYLLKGRDVEFASAASASPPPSAWPRRCSVIVLGDESGYTVGEAQQTKMAAIEAMWETEPAPAGFNLVAWHNEKAQKNDWEVEIPWVMGLIGTRSVSKADPRHPRDQGARTASASLDGIEAVTALEALRSEPRRHRGARAASKRTRPTSASACC